MDTRWLQDFLVLAETGNFTRAAQRRNLSQAAFSRRIQGLEHWVGAPLIDRSVFPTRLTEEGERFRPQALDILGLLGDARAVVSDPAGKGRAHVRIALPYALATARFPEWWSSWSDGGRLSAALTLGNIHDIGTAFVAESVDVLICHHGDEPPLILDEALYDRLVIGADSLRPFAARSLRVAWPGSERDPVPLLAYTPGVYFARLTDTVLEQAPGRLTARRVIESDMADVLCRAAMAGHGVAWLPSSTVTATAGDLLQPVADQAWSGRLSIVAFRHRRERRPAVTRFWKALLEDAAA
jgi:LysR family transcriptional regulator, hypochlorite-specific transcription factor HypT